MAKLFVTLSREEAENIAPVEPIDAGDAADMLNDQDEVNSDQLAIDELFVGIEEAESALDDLQEAENMAAASAGEAPVDVVTGDPVVEPVEGDSETPGVAEPTPTGTEDAVAAPAPEVAAAVATECLRQVKKRLGLESDGIQVSFEGLETRSPITNLTLAREGIGDTAKKVWEAIKNALKKIWEKIVAIWDKITGLFSKQAEVANQIAEEAKELPAEAFNGLDFPEQIQEKIAKDFLVAGTKNTDIKENINYIKEYTTAITRAQSDMNTKVGAAISKGVNKNAGAPGANYDIEAATEAFKDAMKGMEATFATATKSDKLETFIPASAKEDMENVKVLLTNPFDGSVILIGHKKNGDGGEKLQSVKSGVKLDGWDTTASVASLAKSIHPLNQQGIEDLRKTVNEISNNLAPKIKNDSAAINKAANSTIDTLLKKAGDKEGRKEFKNDMKSDEYEKIGADVASGKALVGDKIVNAANKQGKKMPGRYMELFKALSQIAPNVASGFSKIETRAVYYMNASVTAAKRKLVEMLKHMMKMANSLVIKSGKK